MFFIFLRSGFIKMLRADLEKNLRRFVDRFSNVCLQALHAALDSLPVHVPQALTNLALQPILRFSLPATPVNFCLQESSKVLNWWAWDLKGLMRRCTHGIFLSRVCCPCSWAGVVSGAFLPLLVLHTSFLQHMIHIRLADVELPGQRSPWHTQTVTSLFHQLVLACFGVVSVVSGHFHFSFQVSHNSQTFPKPKTPFSWKLQNSQIVSQQEVSQACYWLARTVQRLPSSQFHSWPPSCLHRVLFRKTKLLLVAIVMEVKVVWVDFW